MTQFECQVVHFTQIRKRGSKGKGIIVATYPFDIGLQVGSKVSINGYKSMSVGEDLDFNDCDVIERSYEVLPKDEKYDDRGTDRYRITIVIQASAEDSEKVLRLEEAFRKKYPDVLGPEDELEQHSPDESLI